MGVSGRKTRPLLTFLVVLVGAYAGFIVARETIGILDSLIGVKDPELFRLFGILPISPMKLNPVEKGSLYAVFVIVSGMLGFAIERIAFIQSKRARASLDRMAPQDKIALGAGLVLGLVLTILIRSIFGTPLWANVIIAAFMCYLAVVASYSFAEQAHLLITGTTRVAKPDYRAAGRPKILDTNVIIDGRIADVCRAGFIEGPIYVPKFVLEELQQIADSSDSLKRARGRRGLEILKQMQNEMQLEVPSFSVDDSAEEVDARLVVVAREIGGKIITNDYNLNKVAELQGVEVLNVNELANALKPVVLPGEEMKVTIIKEGKEKEQGIGYLDDGTMIVVEGARRLIGETMDVSVTSVLQTVQGKMIFGKIKEESEENYSSIDGNIRSYTSGRPRRKIR